MYQNKLDIFLIPIFLFQLFFISSVRLNSEGKSHNLNNSINSFYAELDTVC